MRYISLFSGIEAASVAWEPLGWEPMAFAEIDPFPAAVLAHRFPDVPNLGDVCNVDWKEFVRRNGRPDVVVGGSPCFPAGTLVLTDKRFTPIEDVKVGDLVLTHKGNFKRVLNVGGHHLADTVMLEGQGTAGIECTPNHPFWSTEKAVDDDLLWHHRKFAGEPSFVKAEDMVGRMWLNVTRVPKLPIPGIPTTENGKSPLNCGFFYLMGRYLGNGTLANNEIHIGYENGEEYVLRERLKRVRFMKFSSDGVALVRYDMEKLIEWIGNNFGWTSRDKHFPTWALGMSEKFRKSLLDGYVASRTHWSYQELIDSNKELLLGFKVLAGSLGYTTSLSVFDDDHGLPVLNGPHLCSFEYDRRHERFDPSGIGYWGEVRRVTPCRRKTATVYNLEVEDDHSYTVDAVGCSNCQSFSVAGGRESLAGESRQMFEYVRACEEIRSPWILWENVPGVLNVRDNAFGQLLEMLQGVGYVSLAWRVLDSQFFSLAQRRRRVFLVGHLGTDGGAAAVLFESESVRGNTQTDREKREELAKDARGRAEEDSGGIRSDEIAFAQGQRGEARFVGGNGGMPGRIASERRSDYKNETLVCMASGQANAEISEMGIVPTLTRLHEAPIVCHENRFRICLQ